VLKLKYVAVIPLVFLLMSVAVVATPTTKGPYLDPWKIDISGMPDIESMPIDDGAIHWTKVKLPEQCKSADGSDMIIMTSRGTSNNVLIYLEGGGASWNYQMARGKIPILLLNFLTGKRSIYTRPFFGELKAFYRMGMFNRLNPENPFKDWNMILIPFVSEDVHAGNRVAVYTDPATGKTETVYHLGHANAVVVERWAAEHFGDADHVLLCGSSAGGYGCWANWLSAKQAFGEDKRIDIFADSAPGLICQPGNVNNDLQRANWGYTDVIPEDAKKFLKDDGQIIYILKWIHDAYPYPENEDKIIVFDYRNDVVLAPIFLNWTPKEWESYLISAMDDIMNYTGNDPRIAGLFPKGMMHTILMLPTFYTQKVDAVVGGQEYHGVKVVDWARWLVYDTPLPET